MQDRPTLYLESSVISYMSSRRSGDLLVSAHQLLTERWWLEASGKYDVVISTVVMEEIRRGDAVLAKKRLGLAESFRLVALPDTAITLAEKYLKEIPLPPHTRNDALHLAIASVYGIDYLLTWNCRHIANGEVRRKLRIINQQLSVHMPEVCTPEELLGEYQELD